MNSNNEDIASIELSNPDENDIEHENEYGKDEDSIIIKPFNPIDVVIDSQTLVLSNVIERLKHHEIDLEPDFQRQYGLWDATKQSRLIESLIIRIPLPSFYFDANLKDEWIVVDGLQRIWTFYCFMALTPNNPKKLKLENLEYVKQFNGKTFEELPRDIQRRIKEQTLNAYIIRPGTPEKVRNSIFRRINTGGISLTPAEIKNSVYRGNAANLLKELAQFESFKKATNSKVPPQRMLDREFVNRFLSFYILPINEYDGNLDDFLCAGLDRIQLATNSNIDGYRHAFNQAMETAYRIFATKAFRKRSSSNLYLYGPINKPLFECISVNLARLNAKEISILETNNILFLKHYQELFNDNEFYQSISNATGTRKNVLIRHKKVQNLFKEFFNDKLYSNTKF